MVSLDMRRSRHKLMAASRNGYIEISNHIDADTTSETERQSDRRNLLTFTARVLFYCVRRGRKQVNESISVPLSTAL